VLGERRFRLSRQYESEYAILPICLIHEIGGGKPVKRTWGENELESVLTINEVAEILRMHSTTVYRLVRRGELPGFKIGGHWRFNRASLDLFLSGDSSQQLTTTRA
jgi:excisionase family DNA binding protein